VHEERIIEHRIAPCRHLVWSQRTD